MSRSRTKKSKTTQTPLFIEKLIDILEDSSIDNIISWTTTSDSFQIKSISQFTETILPRFFKHNNFSSFIRQLNMYGFRKIRHEDGDNVYENENFKRGNRALLKNIKRKVNLEKEDRIAIYAQQGHSNNSLSRQIQQMKTKQKDLQQICRHLLLQNHKLIQENNNLMKKFKEEERRKERKIEQLLIAMIAANQNKQPALMNGTSNCPVMFQQSANNNVGNMLSIMTGQNDGDLNLLNQRCQETPLEVLTNALSRNKSMKQFKQMLQKYYSNDSKQQSEMQHNGNLNNNDIRLTRRKTSDLNNKNGNLSFVHKYGMISPQKNNENQSLIHDDDSSVFNFSHQLQSPLYQEHANQINDSIKHTNEDEEGFISINDFMNLDEEKPILQQKDNIDLQESN